MRRISKLLISSVMFISVACGETPAGLVPVAIAPAANTAFNFSVNDPGGDPVIVPGSIVADTVGHEQSVSFSDTNGNNYHLEGVYDSNGRLIRLDSYINGQLLGTDNLSWSGSTFNGSYNQGAYGYQVTGDANLQVVSYSITNPYPHQCEPEDPTIEPPVDPQQGPTLDPGCKDDTLSRNDSLVVIINGDGILSLGLDSCGEETLDLVEATLELVSTFLGAGAFVLTVGSTPASAGFIPMAASGAVAAVSKSMMGWYRKMRAIDNCHRVQRGLDPR